jgi:hypothetical protein
VEVPIAGFYALAPYLLVLVHFNLLLSLQLLSRKLYACDDAARTSGDVGGLHDQINIFPYNHYLIGQPGRLVRGFLALVVTITMLLLTLAALLTMQARFLAYQSEAVTWAQRLAIWLDVSLITIFWPVIMDRHDSWSAYMGNGAWHADPAFAAPLGPQRKSAAGQAAYTRDARRPARQRSGPAGTCASVRPAHQFAESKPAPGQFLECTVAKGRPA